MSDPDGTKTPTSSVGLDVHFLQHTRSRLRHFLKPDGRKVHIVSSPEEAVRLRRRLSVVEKGEFDIVIHGDEEHVRIFQTYFRGQRDLLILGYRSMPYGKRIHITKLSEMLYTSSTAVTLRSLSESFASSIA